MSVYCTYRNMDLERPLVERIVQKSLITAQSRDRNLSEDEERADQSASEIPPTPRLYNIYVTVQCDGYCQTVPIIISYNNGDIHCS